MKNNLENAITELVLRITRTEPKQSAEQTLCLLYADGSHLFIAARAGELNAYTRIPFNRRDYVQASFTSAHLPCSYYNLEQ